MSSAMSIKQRASTCYTFTPLNTSIKVSYQIAVDAIVAIMNNVVIHGAWRLKKLTTFNVLKCLELTD